MDCLKSVKKLSVDDITQLLSALARFPYFGGFISLLNSLLDLYELLANLIRKKIIEKKVVVTAAFYCFCSHALIGLGGLVPLVTLAAFMVVHPCIIPLAALVPVAADLHKFCKITRTLEQMTEENEITFKRNPSTETLKTLKKTRELLYQAKRDRFISICLVIGTTLSALGLIFPPLLMAGLGISLTSALLGFLDKRYHVSERICRFIFGENTMEEERLVKTNTADVSAVSFIKRNFHFINAANNSVQNSPTTTLPPRLKNYNKQYPGLLFTTQQPVLSVTPTMITKRFIYP